MLVAAVSLAVLLIVGAGLLIHASNKRSPFYTTKLVDKDTGETVLYQPNQIPESSAGSPVILFGGQAILDSGATQEQYRLIQKDLTAYATNTLHSQYATLTFVPAGLKSSSGSISGQLRLGQSGNAVMFAINLSQLKYVRVQIKDPAGTNGGNYDSGKQQVPAAQYTGND